MKRFDEPAVGGDSFAIGRAGGEEMAEYVTSACRADDAATMEQLLSGYALTVSGNSANWLSMDVIDSLPVSIMALAELITRYQAIDVARLLFPPCSAIPTTLLAVTPLTTSLRLFIGDEAVTIVHRICSAVKESVLRWLTLPRGSAADRLCGFVVGIDEEEAVMSSGDRIVMMEDGADVLACILVQHYLSSLSRPRMAALWRERVSVRIERGYRMLSLMLANDTEQPREVIAISLAEMWVTLYLCRSVADTSADASAAASTMRLCSERRELDIGGWIKYGEASDNNRTRLTRCRPLDDNVDHEGDELLDSYAGVDWTRGKADLNTFLASSPPHFRDVVALVETRLRADGLC